MNESAPVMVWSIMDNSWVTLDYWQWINRIGKYTPTPRSHHEHFDQPAHQRSAART